MGLGAFTKGASETPNLTLPYQQHPRTRLELLLPQSIPTSSFQHHCVGNVGKQFQFYGRAGLGSRLDWPPWQGEGCLYDSVGLGARVPGVLGSLFRTQVGLAGPEPFLLPGCFQALHLSPSPLSSARSVLLTFQSLSNPLVTHPWEQGRDKIFLAF